MDEYGIAPALTNTSPRLNARIAGALYLSIFIFAPSGASTATPLNLTITLVCDVGIAVIFYFLLQPINSTLSLLAAFFRLLYVAVMAVNSLDYFGVLSLVRDPRSAATFNHGYGIALAPFGVHCLITGYLIARSTFLPKVLGVLMFMAGLGYVIFISPSLGDKLFFPYIVIPGVLGEGSLTLWLIIKGVNVNSWKERAQQTTT